LGNTWITDITHLLDESGSLPPDLPAPARNLVKHFGALISAASPSQPGVATATGVTCRRRPNRRPCRGEIVAAIEPDSLAIVWQCSVCDDAGLIQNWQGTSWDHSEDELRKTIISKADVRKEERHKITRITYRSGMLHNIGQTQGIETIILQGTSLTSEIVDAVYENRLLELAGEYGIPEVGEPIQYDHLAIEHASGRNEITVYNRAIMLFYTDDDVYERVHRVCCNIA
jgi:hypothetical protein